MNIQKHRSVTADIIREVHEQMLKLIDVKNLPTSLEVETDGFSQKMATSIEESFQTLRILVGLEIPKDARVLEVGAGYGLASICMALLGFNVTALEPGGTGFEDNRKLSELFISRAGVSVTHLSESAETFDFSSVPAFDLIMSNNVLEHIPDVKLALSNLCAAVSPDGIMVHSCANYSFPFEPHYGIPLVPFAPRLTRFFVSSKTRDDGVWRSLNFVTARQVRKSSESNGMVCLFRQGTMSSSIRRLASDHQFAGRHALLARLVRNKLVNKAVVKCLSLPVVLATPMEFIIGGDSKLKSVSVRDWLAND